MRIPILVIAALWFTNKDSEKYIDEALLGEIQWNCTHSINKQLPYQLLVGIPIGCFVGNFNITFSYNVKAFFTLIPERAVP